MSGTRLLPRRKLHAKPFLRKHASQILQYTLACCIAGSLSRFTHLYLVRSFLERVHELASSHDSDELSLPTAAPVAAVALYHLSTVHVHNIIRCFQLNYIIVSLYTSLTMLPANLQPAISCQQRCKFSPMCDMLHPIAAGIQDQGQGWRRGHSEEGEGGSERGTRPAEPGTDQSSSGGCLGGWGQVAEVPAG